MRHWVHGEIDFFDRWSSSYDRHVSQRFLFEPVHRQVCEALVAGGAPGTIVDVGCGTGRLLEAIHHRFPEADLIGIDPSQGMVRVARSRFAGVPRIRIEQAGALDLPLDPASVDVVTTTLSFHHWNEQSASLREVGRVLRPGGRLLLADVLAIGLVGRLLRPLRRRHGAVFRDAAELSAMLRAAGFASWRGRHVFSPAVPVFLVEARVGRLGR
ncbi:MAG: class I SAM-dependent methyltransferase [Candidatus Dormibacteria bacterium]|jgi:ubiquinone/menaquinone biosynthesis C-methylase UbiE